VKNIVLVGERIVYINRSPECELHFNYHNMGAMCGGWTVRWQGFEGNYYWSGDNGKSSNATTLLENLMTLNATLIKPNYTSTSDVPLIDEEREKYKLYLRELRKNLTAEDTVIIGVLAESPYA
jgi:beta-glucosidase